MSAENLNNNNHRINEILVFLEATPTDCFLWHALALEYQKTGETAKAKECFEKVLTIDENYIGSYYHLGKLLQSENKLDDAKQIFENGIAKAIIKKDNHSANELRNALEMLEEEFE